MKEEVRYGPGNPEVNLEDLRNSKLIKGMTKFLKEEEITDKIVYPLQTIIPWTRGEIRGKIIYALRSAKLEGWNSAIEEAARVAGEKVIVFDGKWIGNDIREFREKIAKEIRNKLKKEK